jgi:hypothetical protein
LVKIWDFKLSPEDGKKAASAVFNAKQFGGAATGQARPDASGGSRAFSKVHMELAASRAVVHLADKALALFSASGDELPTITRPPRGFALGSFPILGVVDVRCEASLILLYVHSHTHHVSREKVKLADVAPAGWVTGNPAFPERGCQMPDCTGVGTAIVTLFCCHRACDSCGACCRICFAYLERKVRAVAQVANAKIQLAKAADDDDEEEAAAAAAAAMAATADEVLDEQATLIEDSVVPVAFPHDTPAVIAVEGARIR